MMMIGGLRCFFAIRLFNTSLLLMINGYGQLVGTYQKRTCCENIVIIKIIPATNTEIEQVSRAQLSPSFL